MPNWHFSDERPAEKQPCSESGIWKTSSSNILEAGANESNLLFYH